MGTEGADQADNGTFIREDADNIGASFDLLVQALQRIGAVDFAAMLAWKVHVRQHVGLALIDEGCQLRPLAAKLISSMAQSLAGTGASRSVQGRSASQGSAGTSPPIGGQSIQSGPSKA